MARMTLGLYLPPGMSAEEARHLVQAALEQACEEQGIQPGRVTLEGGEIEVEERDLTEDAQNQLKAGHPVLSEPLAIEED